MTKMKLGIAFLMRISCEPRVQSELQDSLPGFASGEKRVAKRLYSLEALERAVEL